MLSWRLSASQVSGWNWSVGEMFYALQLILSPLHCLISYQFLFLVGPSPVWRALSKTVSSHTLKWQKPFWNLVVCLPRGVCACSSPCTLEQPNTKMYLQSGKAWKLASSHPAWQGTAQNSTSSLILWSLSLNQKSSCLCKASENR